MPADIIQRPSPNFDARPAAIDLIVLHYTGMNTADEAIRRLCDPSAKVSAHYVVDEAGRIFGLVAEDHRAWHAGAGGWGPHENVNSVSVGIEIVNPGHYWGYAPFPDLQIKSVIGLVSDVIQRHGLSARSVVGHSDVAPERKDDPGELFPWDELAAHGLALPPFSGEADPSPPGYEEALAMLSEIGYHLKPTHPVAVVLAFQRRFCPQALGQGLSPLTRTAISAIRNLLN